MGKVIAFNLLCEATIRGCQTTQAQVQKVTGQKTKSRFKTKE